MSRGLSLAYRNSFSSHVGVLRSSRSGAGRSRVFGTEVVSPCYPNTSGIRAFTLPVSTARSLRGPRRPRPERPPYMRRLFHWASASTPSVGPKQVSAQMPRLVQLSHSSAFCVSTTGSSLSAYLTARERSSFIPLQPLPLPWRVVRAFLIEKAMATVRRAQSPCPSRRVVRISARRRGDPTQSRYRLHVDLVAVDCLQVGEAGNGGAEDAEHQSHRRVFGRVALRQHPATTRSAPRCQTNPGRSAGRAAG